MTRSTLAAAWAAALLCAAPAIASDKLARYTVEIKIDGAERWTQSGDSERTTIAQKLRLVTTVKSDGELVGVNSKDPEAGRKALAQAQRMQASPPAAARPAPNMPNPMSQPQMMAQVMQMQARCQGDVQCLHKAASEMAAAQVGPDASTQARLVAFGDERRRCETEHAKDKRKREACIGALERRHGADTPGPADAEDRYLNFFGFEGCKSEMTVQIDDRREGRYADVQGAVPYTVTYRADHQASPVERSLLCSQHSFVLDAKADRLYGDGLVLGGAPGQVIRSERGRDQRTADTLTLRPEAMTWVAQQLRQAPKSGSARATLPLDRHRTRGAAPGGTHEGSVSVELSWRFEEL